MDIDEQYIPTPVLIDVTTSSRRASCLKTVFKRQSCTCLLIANITVLLVLCAALIFFIIVKKTSDTQIDAYEADDELRRRLWSNRTLQYCPYAPPMSPFYSDQCADNCGRDAFVWREKQLHKYNLDDTCLDMREYLDCHETDASRLCLPRRPTLPECAGIFNQSVHWRPDANITVLAQAINDTTLRKAQNRAVLANQLVAHCPVCKRRQKIWSPYLIPNATIPVPDNNPRDIYTHRSGWPSAFEFCDLPIDPYAPWVPLEQAH